MLGGEGSSLAAAAMRKLSMIFGKRIGLLAFVMMAPAAMADGPSPQPAVQSPIVVELFTSQGCISCPPADEYFATLTNDPRLLPLALHVDYWDYIGWQDHFAKPEFTARQKAYALAIGSRTIYTPQFIVGGQDRIEGPVPELVDAAIRDAMGDRMNIELQAQREGDILTIRAEVDPPLEKPVRVHLVRYLPEQRVNIERGENAGKTITYRNIVQDWQLLGDWLGDKSLEVQVPISGPEPAAVLLQKIGPSRIVAAAVVSP